MSHLDARVPDPLDFIIRWDNSHTFEFFEDHDGEALWAHGSLPSEEFVAQVNEYDRINGYDESEQYTEENVETLWAITIELPEPYIQPVAEGTENAGLIKRISR
jgi:hypothetical protein